MWKRLGQPLSAKQIPLVLALLALAVGALYGVYLGVTTVWHRWSLEHQIPAAVAGLRTQRDALSDVIETYKRNFGYYPPLYTAPSPNRGVSNPLCYELLGTRYDPKSREFHIPTTKDGLSVADVEKYFNVHTFSNCLAFPDMPTNFLVNRALAFTPLAKDIEAYGMGINYTEFIQEPFWEDFEFTPWRYATNPAEHNPGKFDLWIEMTVAGKHFIVGNWPEVK